MRGAVKQNGLLLRQATPKHMADCENGAEGLLDHIRPYFSEPLVLGAVEQDVHQADSLISLEAVLKKDTVALKHAALEHKDDRGIVLEAVKQEEIVEP